MLTLFYPGLVNFTYPFLDPPSTSISTGLTRHVRASSDPVSRGGAFSSGSQGLDQEPNPFEQSFSGPRPSSGAEVDGEYNPNSRKSSISNALAGPSSGLAARRARSISPSSAVHRSTPGGTHKLPPLSLIASPGGHDLSGFGWGNIDSLRSGPLSPSLLSGPAHTAGTIFESTLLRTGLTPLGGIAGAVSFPPPSPATAALFAMMTNNTPGTSDAASAGLAGGGSRPHEGVNEGNHFEASFARAAGEGKGGILSATRRGSRDDNPEQILHQQQSVAYAAHIQGPPAPLGALHRSNIIAGGPRANLPPHSHLVQPNSQYLSHQQQQGGPRAGYPPLSHLQQQTNSHLLQLQAHHQHNQSQQPNYGNQNPLYLLSQAQDLNSSHNDDAVTAAAALSNLSGPGGYPMDQSSQQQHQHNGSNGNDNNGLMNLVGAAKRGGRGSSPMNGQSHQLVNKLVTNSGKRGSISQPPLSAAAANKRKKVDDKPSPAGKKGGKRGKAQREEEEMDDFDDGMGEMEGSASPPPSNNPNETEEDKRKNFLERNRQGTFRLTLLSDRFDYRTDLVSSVCT